MLLYATGGLAYASIKWSATLNNILAGGPVSETFGRIDLRWGGVAGVGAEMALRGNWSFKTEALYIRFTDAESTFTSAFAAANGNPTSKSFHNQDALWVARMGLNYRWGGR